MSYDKRMAELIERLRATDDPDEIVEIINLIHELRHEIQTKHL